MTKRKEIRKNKGQKILSNPLARALYKQHYEALDIKGFYKISNYPHTYISSLTVNSTKYTHPDDLARKVHWSFQGYFIVFWSYWYRVGIARCIIIPIAQCSQCSEVSSLFLSPSKSSQTLSIISPPHGNLSPFNLLIFWRQRWDSLIPACDCWLSNMRLHSSLRIVDTMATRLTCWSQFSSIQSSIYWLQISHYVLQEVILPNIALSTVRILESAIASSSSTTECHTHSRDLHLLNQVFPLHPCFTI